MRDDTHLGWIDVSVPISSGMAHWPGDPEVNVKRVQSIEEGDAAANLSFMAMGAHSGTHMDAPVHFIPNGASIDEMPPETAVGPARVIEIRHPQQVTAQELKEHNIKEGERLLLKTRNSSYVWQTKSFVEDFVFITDDAAHFLVERKIKVIGIDYLSVGSFKDGNEVHKILLSGGTWIIEGLNLAGVSPGHYELICLPLRLVGADGAPARAVIRRLPEVT